MTDSRRATADQAETTNGSGTGKSTDPLELLGKAAEVWIARGNPRPLEGWFKRELDQSGAPLRLPVSSWPDCLRILAHARETRPGWPETCHERAGELFEAVLRFSRPTGSLAMTASRDGVPLNERALYRQWGSYYSGSPAARVVSMWFPRRDEVEESPPPLPAWSSSRNPLAVLRADWLKVGDFLTIEHRLAAPTTSCELWGGGFSWLGDEWQTSLSAESPTVAGRPRVQTWQSSYQADCLEWSFRQGETRINRMALLARGKRLALLADQIDYGAGGRGDRGASMTLGTNEDVRAEPAGDTRSILLKQNRSRASAMVLPLALPSLPYVTDRGMCQATETQVKLTQATPSRRAWLPLLVSWDGVRNRKSVNWRILTVTERAKICPPEVAFAAKVRWGADETYVVYRSLGKPGLRAFLGYQTRARFLLGTFTREGTVKPIISID